MGAEGSGVPELFCLDEQVLLANLLHSQKTIKEHHEDLMVGQKEQGRRRKKFVRGVESKRIQRLQTLQEEEVMSQLLNPSKSELGDDKKRSHVVNHTRLIRDNRGNRDTLLTKVCVLLYIYTYILCSIFSMYVVMCVGGDVCVLLLTGLWMCCVV